MEWESSEIFRSFRSWRKYRASTLYSHQSWSGNGFYLKQKLCSSFLIIKVRKNYYRLQLQAVQAYPWIEAFYRSTVAEVLFGSCTPETIYCVIRERSRHSDLTRKICLRKRTLKIYKPFFLKSQDSLWRWLGFLNDWLLDLIKIALASVSWIKLNFPDFLDMSVSIHFKFWWPS